ncbi:MAG: hypothetical protein Q4G03_11970 [Planctomycetia bacterium]|nr:hypothetical protein [Planctomycetia bacterium]
MMVWLRGVAPKSKSKTQQILGVNRHEPRLQAPCANTQSFSAYFTQVDTFVK